jgi:hypothetical protein
MELMIKKGKLVYMGNLILSKFSMHHAFCFSLGFGCYLLIAGHLATASTPANPSNQDDVNIAHPPLTLVCNQGLGTIAKDLNGLEIALAPKVKLFEADAFNQDAWIQNSEKRMAILFAPFLLPAKTPFLSMYIDCWSRLADFERVAKNDSNNAALEEFRRWRICAKALDLSNTTEIDKLASCVQDASHN